MTRHVVSLGAAALALLLALGGCRPADAPLVYRFQPGSVYLYADTSKVLQTQEMMGQEMKITSASTSRTRLVGESVASNGAMTLVTSLDSMVLDTKSPMKDTVIVMTDLLGKRVRVSVAPNGTVLNREVIDSVKLAGRMMRTVSLREIVRLHRLSSGPVNVDSTWQSDAVDTAEAMGGKLLTHTTMHYVVTGKPVIDERVCFEIGYKGDIGLEGKGAMMGMELFMEGKGKTSGRFVFDPAMGLIIREDSNMDTEMTAAVTGQQNMTIPITTSAKRSHKLISVEKVMK